MKIKKSESARCNVCGERMPEEPAVMMMHLLFEHPVEFIQSDSGQSLIKRISGNLAPLVETLFSHIKEF
jgi:hypothetical protein